MDYETVAAAVLGRAMKGLTINLLCRDVRREVAFLGAVFGLKAQRVSDDFAIVLHEGQLFQLHSDASFAGHPLHALLPEAGPRGVGVELRLHGIDPDLAATRLGTLGMVLQAPRDKSGHGLREAVILDPEGYAWVPSVPLAGD